MPKGTASVDTENGLRQWFIKCSYSICSSLGKTGGGKKEFLKQIHLVSCIPQNEVVVLVETGMGISEVIMYATMERMVVTGLECRRLQDFGVCRWAKPSHLQYTVHEAGI